MKVLKWRRIATSQFGGGEGGQIRGAENPNLHISTRRLRGLCGGFSPICLIISNPGGGGGGRFWGIPLSGADAFIVFLFYLHAPHTPPRTKHATPPHAAQPCVNLKTAPRNAHK